MPAGSLRAACSKYTTHKSTHVSAKHCCMKSSFGPHIAQDRLDSACCPLFGLLGGLLARIFQTRKLVQFFSCSVPSLPEKNSTRDPCDMSHACRTWSLALGRGQYFSTQQRSVANSGPNCSLNNIWTGFNFACSLFSGVLRIWTAKNPF